MSAYRIPVVPKRKVDFSTLASGSSEDLVLADRIELVHWREVTLLVAISDHTLGGGTGTISVLAIPQSWTEEEPNFTFLSTTSFGVVISSATPTPGYLNTSIKMVGSGSMGAMARIIARGSRTSGAIGSALSATVSVELAATDG